MLFRTLRLRIIARDPAANPYDLDSQEQYFYSVWHDSMVMPVFAAHHPRTLALTSQHSDGSFVAAVLKWRNIDCVRGSTNRISTGSVRRLLQATDSHHLVITPDGPRGPNRQMSTGIVFFASRTGRAIVPTAFVCSRCWRWKGSWSDLIIPKPFAKVVLLAGEPIHVPAELSTEELQEHVAQVQEAMDLLDEQAKLELDGKSVPAKQESISKAA